MGRARPKVSEREIDVFGNEVRGLSDTQLRVLKVLFDRDALVTSDWLTCPAISSLSGVSEVVVTRALGAIDVNQRASAERAAGYTSLLSHGMIGCEQLEGVWYYGLTPYGLETCRIVRDAMNCLPAVKS